MYIAGSYFDSKDQKHDSLCVLISLCFGTKDLKKKKKNHNTFWRTIGQMVVFSVKDFRLVSEARRFSRLFHPHVQPAAASMHITVSKLAPEWARQRTCAGCVHGGKFPLSVTLVLMELVGVEQVPRLQCAPRPPPPSSSHYTDHCSPSAFLDLCKAYTAQSATRGTGGELECLDGNSILCLAAMWVQVCVCVCVCFFFFNIQ